MASPGDWLGLARRCGKAAVGRYACRQALRRRQAALLVVAEDGSPGSRRYWERAARTAGVELVVWGSQEALARALGAAGRVAVAAVLEPGLAARFSQAVRGGVVRDHRPADRVQE